MKFVMINGPSCSGKSVIIQRVIEAREGYYYLSFDGQRWFFSKYDGNVHAADVEEVVLVLGEALCKKKYNIICDSGLEKYFREKLLAIAKKNDYEIIEFNLETKFEILLDRFKKRVALATQNPYIKIPNTSLERFKELYDIYEKEKSVPQRTFRTDNEQSEEEIAKSILEII